VSLFSRHTLYGEATLTTTVLLIGVALVTGIGILSYTVVTLGNYRSQMDLVNTLRYEAGNIFVNTILYDSSTSTLWLLFKRLDGSIGNYYVVVESGGVYLNCSRIQVYNPLNDANGVLCDNPWECLTASTVYRGGLKGVYALHPSGVIDFESYARAQKYPLGSIIEACRIPSVCILTGKRGLCDDNTIVRVDLSGLTMPVRIHVAVEYNRVLYVVGTYAPL
jgi:hypothetical protein